MEEDGRGSALPFLLVWRARLFTRRERDTIYFFVGNCFANRMVRITPSPSFTKSN